MHARRDRNNSLGVTRRAISTFIPGVASMAKNMMNSNVDLVLTPEKKVVTSMFFFARATPRATRVVQNANTFSTGNNGINPSEDFSETSELGSVVAARGSTYKRRMASIARDRAAQNFPAPQLRTVRFLFFATIREESSLVVVRQVGSTENRFFGLGNRKAAGRS